MSGAHEKLERAEHAAHGGGHNKLFGVTMALIGVLIALSGAMVGSGTKRVDADNDRTNASPLGLRKRQHETPVDYDRAGEATRQGGCVEGRPGGMGLRWKGLSTRRGLYQERNLAKSWADNYLPLVDTHFKAAEGYEKSQLIAEIGIVLASLGVLLASPASLAGLRDFGVGVHRPTRPHLCPHQARCSGSAGARPARGRSLSGSA